MIIAEISSLLDLKMSNKVSTKTFALTTIFHCSDKKKKAKFGEYFVIHYLNNNMWSSFSLLNSFVCNKLVAQILLYLFLFV